MKYQFHPDALEEYREAALWYSNRERELALRFTNAIEETVRRIVENPERWRVVEEDVRRCLTRNLPFCHSVHHRTRFHTNRGSYALEPRTWLLARASR
jgi:plasmid stabilization system protein ParE